MQNDNYSSKTNYLGPNLSIIMEEMGNQIRLARLRRDYPSEIIAKRAGISRATLWKIEKGDASVSIGAYAKVLNALNMERDLLYIAKDDAFGKLLQDAKIENKYKR
ncbi:MAG: helix-turn-helix transcriptional regulator [Lachnospiraceae bacterium]|nr:helix-turn-helix transcriptional regulator [Lachnospiraceae bacterium]